MKIRKKASTFLYREYAVQIISSVDSRDRLKVEASR